MPTPENDAQAGCRASGPLRVAALAKQVPVGESLSLRSDGRLDRGSSPLEMNPYCRRAVSKGTELAKASGGTCTVFTMGPPEAEDVLREAVAWGATEGVHLCDPMFGGSDTLATAQTLVAALRRCGTFDLVLVGRSTVDGDTGQVGPEIAELLDLPFAAGVRRLELDGELLRLELEQDDGHAEVELALPAVLSVAERLCEPCKADPAGRAAVPDDRLCRITADDLGDGPWGEAASPTRVGDVRTMIHVREGRRLSGPVRAQVEHAVTLLAGRGALGFAGGLPGRATVREDATPLVVPSTAEQAPPEAQAQAAGATDHAAVPEGAAPVVAVVLEPDRPQVDAELVGAAARLAAEVGGLVTVHCYEGVNTGTLAAFGAHHVVAWAGSAVEEDVAGGLVRWAREHPPWVVLAPSTSFGREVAGRAAAALGAGLVGDAVSVEVVSGSMVAAKPAFAGSLVADITCTSPVQLVTLRPGVLPVPPAPSPGSRLQPARHEVRHLVPRGRVRVVARRRDDDVEVLARAPAVIGVGTGVRPEEYPSLSPLAAILGAELAATRKVTDKGWAPRSRQVGLTGRSIAPRLYVALGLSGKFNHMVGVRSAETVLAINSDPEAAVFDVADIGIEGDWHDVLPELEVALRRLRGAASEDGPVLGSNGSRDAAETVA